MTGKTIVFIFLSIIGLQSAVAQKVDLKLDYTVQYLVEKSKDTVELSIAENGKYLFTDSKLLVNKFGEQLRAFPGLTNSEKAEIKILLNLADMELLFYLRSGKTGFLMNLSIPDMLPNTDIALDDKASILAQDTSERIELMNKSYALHHLYPAEEPGEKILVAFDEDYEVDYNENFSSLFSLILKNNVTIDAPRGIFVYIKDEKGQEVMRAINITKESRTISADLNFELR